MVHAKELRHGEYDPSVPREKGQGHKYDVEEQGWEQENGDFGIPLDFV